MKDLITHLKALQPLKTFGEFTQIDFSKPELEFSLIIPAKSSAETLESTVSEADTYLRKLSTSRNSTQNSKEELNFEIILVPNPAPGDRQDHSVTEAKRLARKFPSVRVCEHPGPCGKGAAIRSGFSISRGQWIFLTDADLPYDLDFFERALEKLKSGYDLVTGNRRLPQSIFHIPVHLLPLAYGRHRLGLGFNHLVRFLLPISTTDTQAGIKALSRRLALKAFSRQICPGFLFDLELFLTAKGHGYAQMDLPVKLYLNSEKSTVRILRECLLVAFWLVRLSIRNRRGLYGPHSVTHSSILRRYRNAPLTTRIFLILRWLLTPYGRMAAHLPQVGTILDLGCGHGLFALKAALGSPSRTIVGIDHDPGRISLGTEAARDLKNIKLSNGSLTNLPKDLAFTGVAMIDVMHYFDSETQKSLFKNIYDRLQPGGTLIVREVNPKGGAASAWNRLYEKLATRIGFTRSEKKEELFFRSIQGWTELLESIGYKVQSEPCTSVLFADILYICERP